MLFEMVTIDLHYMTNRTVGPKNIKSLLWKVLWKQRHLHLWCPWGKL